MFSFSFDKKNASLLERWTLQFVFLRPTLSIMTLIFQLLDVYNNVAIWLPISILLNISVTLAVYALMLFYHAFEKDLSIGKQRPLAKFLSIKGVVFFAFWQGLILQGLISIGWLKAGSFFSAVEESTIIQDLLVCIEMGILFSPLQLYAFSHLDYQKMKKL